jgi:transcriptional regulator with XRE-family HTH domain
MLIDMSPATDSEREEAAARRMRLLAALAHTGMSQAELVRRMNLAGEKTATTTVNRWCVGKVPISEATLRYVLTRMGLSADWKAPGPSDA